MSWHRLWHQQDDSTRPEAPSSKLRRAMRKQMRDDAKRMVITPKKRKRNSNLRNPPRDLDEPPEAWAAVERCKQLPDDIYMPKNWWRG